MLQTRELPIDSILLSDDFFRSEYDPEKYSELMESIRQFGVLHPLITIETDKGNMLIAGYRRFKASKELGLPTIPCYILKMGVDDAEIMRLHENLFREDISPLQEAVSFARLEQTYHFTREKIAKLVGKSKSYITQKIQVLNWPLVLQEALAKNLVSYSVGRELSQVDETNELRVMLETCITSGASVRTVLGWVAEWKQRKLTTEQTPKVKVDTNVDNPNGLKDECWLCGHVFDDTPNYKVNLCDSCFETLRKDAEPKT